MTISLAIGYALSRLLKIADNHKGTFVAAFFGSSATFVGVPVNLALFGEISIPYAILYMLVNATMFWTVGNYLISTDGPTKTQKLISMDSAKNIFSPPLMGILVAVVLILLEVHLPAFLTNAVKSLGNMTTPLSMLFIGIVMYGVNIRQLRLTRDVTFVLLGRFVVSPLLVLAVIWFIPVPDLMKKVFVIQSALPAMTNVPILAKLYGADAEYGAVLVTLTTILAMIAIPVYMVIV